MRALLAVALLGAPVAAHAKAQTELSYRMEEVFSTATRFVRVDRGCTITDKDPEAAFVMFECPLAEDGKRVARGGLEIFPSTAGGRISVRVQVTLSDEPHGTELRWLELLERKMRDERGTPPAPPRPSKTPAAPPRDMGTATP